MTLALAPRSAPSVAAAAREFQLGLNHLTQLDLSAMSEADQADVLRTIGGAVAQLAAFRLALLRTAEETGTASRSGLATTGQWAAHVANSDPASAEREVRLAEGLGRRRQTAEALQAGALSPEHAAVIVQADAQLPAATTAPERSTIERELIRRAQKLAPGALKKAARRAISAVEADRCAVDAHEDSLLADEESRARAKTRLWIHDNGDGTVTGRFTVPTLQGHLLRKVLETITAPRRGRLGATQAQAGDNTGLQTDWGRARGEALCELIEHLPTDHLHPRTAATVVVTLDDATLRGALRAAQLDTGEQISSGEARRLLCNARVIPAVLNGRSVPLDLGRSARLFSDGQRTALGLNHPTCATDGCERPFAWSELHHLEPWHSGGPTNLTNAVPLCHFHHQRIHDRDYEHRVRGDSSITFHRRI